jgi:hypothetical protein
MNTWKDWSPKNKIKLLETLRQKNSLNQDCPKRNKAYSDINYFIENTIKDKETKEYIRQGSIHEKLQSAIDVNRWLMFGMPREHGKTTQTIGRILYEIGKNTDLRIKIISSNDKQAGKRVSAIKDFIQFNKDYQYFFPNVKPMKGMWGKTSFSVEREIIDSNPTIEGAGVLSTGAGDRADIIVFDDPCDMRNSIQEPALRDKVYQSITNVWLNLLSPNGKVIWIYTPWHEEDAAALFKKSGTFHVIEHYIDHQFTPVFPEKWGKKELIERHAIILDRAFGRGFRGEAISDEERVFKNIESIRDYSLSLKDIEQIDSSLKIAGVDLAISKRKGSAYTVIFGIMVDEDGNKSPIDIIRKKISSTATAAWILYSWIRYGYDTIIVEANAYQQSLEEWIEFFHNSLKIHVKIKKENNKTVYEINEKALDRLYSDNKSLSSDVSPVEWAMMKPYLAKGALGTPYIKPFVTGRQKADEIIGVPGFAADLASGSWILPSKGCDVGCDCEICNWVREMNSYQMDGQTSSTKDIIMAAWFAASEIRAGDFSIRVV